MNYKIFSWVLILSGLVFPFSVVSPGSAQPNNAECQKELKELNKKWQAKEGKELTTADKFVWTQLCEENVHGADLTKHKEEDRILSFKFLQAILRNKAILLNKEYNEKLPTRIKIRGAIFNEPIDFVSENIDREVSLLESTFKKPVDLSNANFSKSLSFDDSTFDQGIKLRDATIKGTLSFQRVKFNAYSDSIQSLDICRTLLDLQRVQVENNLNLNDSVFTCSYPTLPIKEDIDLIDLRAANIKVTVNLNRISLIKKNEKVSQKHKEIGVSLIASQIGDAIFIDQNIAQENDGQSRQIDYIDMTDVRANGLVFYVDPTIADEIKNYRIFRIVGQGSDDYTKLTVQNNYFFDLDIRLQNATIKTISIIANPESREQTYDNKDDFSCKMKLGGFNYSQLETTAFKFLTICVDSLYLNATRLADGLIDAPDQQEEANRQLIQLLFYAPEDRQTEADKQLSELVLTYIRPEDQQEEANRQLIQLLQPIEKLSVVSKSLGVSAVEKEMMYRQKKLEYYLAKTNLSQSQSNFWDSFNSNSDKKINDLRREFEAVANSSWTLVTNTFQDKISGYGFHRLRIFNIIIPILILNFLLGLFVSYQKQKKNAYESWYFKTKEIKDEKISDYVPKQEPTSLSKKLGKDIIQQKTKQDPLTLQAVSQDIDTILQVIFESYNPEQDCFYLYFKYNNNNEYNSYKKIKLNPKEFKYLVGILDNRNPTHTKIGFCKNYYPKGKWSVVTAIKPKSPKSFKKVKEASIYIVEHKKLINGMTFESINPLRWPMEIAKTMPKYYILLILLILLSKPCPKKRLKVAIDKTTINMLDNNASSKREKEGQPKWMTDTKFQNVRHTRSAHRKPLTLPIYDTAFEKWYKFSKKWILSSSLVKMLSIVKGMLITLSTMMLIIIIYRFFIIKIIVLLFLVLEITIFSLRKDKNLAWITQKNLENAFLFSFDILIPIIELDKENLDFILDAAEEYTLIRIYFRIEKLIGPVLISVLLPLLLITGL